MKKIIIIPINKNEYISDVEPFKSNGLDTNVICIKEITGCGITQYAIRHFNTNLILTLPNVPVIEDKVSKHNKEFPNAKILGVHKGVEVDDIKEYLLSDVPFKKILTTPEGFIYKVKRAFYDINTMYKNFFMLYDECERIITDVDYRGDIAAPIDDFFLFKRKAMVSATVLPFSDERFKDFRYYKIEPTYDYSKPITVIGTNSILSSLQKRISEFKGEHICIFMNSTSGINAIANSLNIVSESRAFCAQDSVVKLMERKYFNASSKFDVSDMKKYNFFTSRYFSAIDMKVDYKPHIIMVTDVIFAEHSILDPHTEVIQIAGRFRNGINSLTHIANFNSELKSMNNEEALYYLKGCFDTYDGFVDSHAKTSNPGSRDMLKKAIDDSPAHSFYINGRVNAFMVDNFLNTERVKGYYQSFDNLKATYHMREKHFRLIVEEDKCVTSDASLYKLDRRISKNERHKLVADLFDSWKSTDKHFVFPPEELRSSFIAKYPELWEAHLHLTKEEMEVTDFVIGKLKQAVKKAKELDLLRFLSKQVYKVFQEHTFYFDPLIMEKLVKIYENEGIDIKISYATIGKFFEAQRTTSDGGHGYRLKKKRFINFSED